MALPRSEAGNTGVVGTTLIIVSLAFIPPGQPGRNGYIESFNGRLHDECRPVVRGRRRRYFDSYMRQIRIIWSATFRRSVANSSNPRLEARINSPDPAVGDSRAAA
ncbi:transposase [Nocardia sp. SYP-A9097]|nr:transposase [Nocardia sp. SYP-A9097]